MTSPPILGLAAPEFTRIVEEALRKKGADALADQIAGLRIAVQCTCSPRCGAFLCVPLDERGGRSHTVTLALVTAEMIVNVMTIDDVIVGLDVLDDGQLRTAVDSFAKPV